MVLARTEVERVTDALAVAMDSAPKDEPIAERIERLGIVAALARDLIRKAHREQLELRREELRIEEMVRLFQRRNGAGSTSR